MSSNKYNKRGGKTRLPPQCKSKKPRPTSYPSETIKQQPGSPPDPFHVWVRSATLPAIPNPPFNSIQIRNLTCNVWAAADNNAWLNNLRQVKLRWDLFNGRRLVHIADDQDTVSPDRIIEYLGPAAEYLVHPNDPRLRETPGFRRLLHAVRNCNPNEATFYCHTKGASPFHHVDPRRDAAKTYWRNRMYHELLDTWPRVAAALQNHAVAGIYQTHFGDVGDFDILSPTGLLSPAWHFSGAFFWFRHDCTFRNPEWSSIPDDPYASECWPGRLFHFHQAATLYQPWPPDRDPMPDYYDPETHLDPIGDIPF